jgi:hypothetical protein
MGLFYSEDRGQKTEGRGLKTEVRRQKSEGRGQKIDDRGLKTDVRRQIMDIICLFIFFDILHYLLYFLLSKY